MSKTVFITGASTGFGKLSAKKFQREGWNVVATMRSPQKENELNQLDNILVTELDVTKPETITNAVNEAIEKFGTIDVLVNNAGYGAAGPMEAGTDAQIRYQMEVNFFGLINVTKGILPVMRAKKSGTIINISSMGGRITFPYLSLYHATKFAVEGLTESMQYELDPLGINLKIVEPGAFNTDFSTRSLQLFDTSNLEDYQEHLQKFLKVMEATAGSSGDPQEVAETIYAAATDSSDRLRYLVGEDAIQILGARGQMDDASFKKMMLENLGLS